MKRGAKKMVSYKKLWHLLLDRDLKKKDLVTVAGVSSYTVNKLTRGDNVTTDVLQKICKSLECDIGDIMEILPDETNG
jgi:DNA-binding Xre family transcriptional regulator